MSVCLFGTNERLLVQNEGALSRISNFPSRCYLIWVSIIFAINENTRFKVQIQRIYLLLAKLFDQIYCMHKLSNYYICMCLSH